jgi:hypothetical protein
MMSNILFLFDANTSRVPGYAPFFVLIAGGVCFAHLFNVYFAMFCLFVSVLFLVCSIVICLSPVSCVLNSYLSHSCVLCAQWLFVAVLCLVCPLVICLSPVSCVPNGYLSQSCVLCAQWFSVSVLCLVCPMLPVYLDTPFWLALLYYLTGSVLFIYLSDVIILSWTSNVFIST